MVRSRVPESSLLRKRYDPSVPEFSMEFPRVTNASRKYSNDILTLLEFESKDNAPLSAMVTDVSQLLNHDSIRENFPERSDLMVVLAVFIFKSKILAPNQEEKIRLELSQVETHEQLVTLHRDLEHFALTYFRMTYPERKTNTY